MTVAAPIELRRRHGSQATARTRGKLRSLQILAGEDIGLLVTGFAQSTNHIDGLIELVDTING